MDGTCSSADACTLEQTLSRKASRGQVQLPLQALSKVLPVVAQRKLDAGGYMILRPDSGDPVECVLMALRCSAQTSGAPCWRMLQQQATLFAGVRCHASAFRARLELSGTVQLPTGCLPAAGRPMALRAGQQRRCLALTPMARASRCRGAAG